MTSWERAQIVSQRRSITFSRAAKIWLWNPLLRSSYQICSIGFISGVYGRIKNSRIFSGTRSETALCQAAPSQHSRTMSSGYCFSSFSKKIFMQTVLQYGRTKKQDSPVSGSTAPYTYRYSQIWWQGMDGRLPFLHQQYFGLLILPKPASSWNINRTFPLLSQRLCISSINSWTFCLIFLRS